MDREAVPGSQARVFSDRFGKSPVPVGLLISPDGKRAWVASTNADVVSILDLEKLEVVGRLTAGKEPDGLAGRFSR
jgi:DNA-binding beta-propeller fold protein YncE